MALRVPVFLDVDGNFVGYSGIDGEVDSVNLGGLTMAGQINMTGGSPPTASKIVGLDSASASGDALAYGQSGASLAGLSLTADLAMGTNKITGLAPATTGTDAPNYTQLQSVAAGVQWKHAVTVLEMVSDTLSTSPSLGTGDAGKAYVLAGTGGDWTTFAIGDIVEWDGSAWNLILTNSGGEPPDKTRVIIVDTSAAGSFAGQENKVAEYDSGTNTWSFTSPVNGEGRTINGNGSVYENLGYIYDSTPGEWVMFNGPGQVVAGDGLTKTFNQLDVNVKDGVKIDSDAVTISLHATTPGLQLTGTTPNQVLSVYPDGTKGVEVGASGVAVKVEADGAIVFDTTNGGLETNLETTNPTLDIVGNELGVKYGSTTSGLTKDTNGLKVYVDDVTVTINGSGQLAAITSDGDRIADDYNVNEAIAAGDPVYWSSTSNRVAKGDADKALWPSHAQIFGISEDTQTTVGNPATIIARGPCRGVLSGASSGDIYWLANGGGLTATIPSSGDALIRVGWAMNANDLFVSIADYGKKP